MDMLAGKAYHKHFEFIVKTVISYHMLNVKIDLVTLGC